jgi:hypothetical protein
MLYLITSAVIGWLAHSKGRHFTWWFIWSILFTPVFSVLLLLTLIIID